MSASPFEGTTLASSLRGGRVAIVLISIGLAVLMVGCVLWSSPG